MDAFEDFYRRNVGKTWGKHTTSGAGTKSKWEIPCANRGERASSDAGDFQGHAFYFDLGSN